MRPNLHWRRADAAGQKASLDVALRGGNDFSTTSVCLIILLATWAGRGPHKGSKWAVAHNVVRARASTLLRAILKQ